MYFISLESILRFLRVVTSLSKAESKSCKDMPFLITLLNKIRHSSFLTRSGLVIGKNECSSLIGYLFHHSSKLILFHELTLFSDNNFSSNSTVLPVTWFDSLMYSNNSNFALSVGKADSSQLAPLCRFIKNTKSWIVRLFRIKNSTVL